MFSFLHSQTMDLTKVATKTLFLAFKTQIVNPVHARFSFLLFLHISMLHIKHYKKYTGLFD
jgi:hypothetical protein